MRFDCWRSALLAGLLCACKHESTVTVSSNCFDFCLDASANVDLEGHLVIADELRDSFESARVGLSAYAGAANSLTRFVQSVIDLNPGLPAGLSYAGAGTYRLQSSADTNVELQFFLPSNTSYGATGDLIQFDLFDVANYFTSLAVKTTTTVSLSGISSSLSFTFDRVGPGAELLGIASTAASPIPIDVNAFTSQLSKVIVRARVSAAHRSNTANIAFALEPAPIAASAVGSATIPLTISRFAASGLTVDQSVSLDSFAMSLLNPGATYDGTIRARAMSPDFSFQMLISYDSHIQGDITLGCIGAAP